MRANADVARVAAVAPLRGNRPCSSCRRDRRASRPSCAPVRSPARWCRCECRDTGTPARAPCRCAVLTSTMSPRSMPSLFAVSGMHLDPRAPEHLGDRIGQLLQPGLVRAAAVAEHRRVIRDEEVFALRLLDRRRGSERDRTATAAARARCALATPFCNAAVNAFMPPGSGSSASCDNPSARTSRRWPDPSARAG